MRQSARIESPCCRHCCLNDDDICIGCWRTLSEILMWNHADDTQRAEILARCQQRSQQQSRPDNNKP